MLTDIIKTLHEKLVCIRKVAIIIINNLIKKKYEFF
jgi:hypothetical protein